MWFFDDDLLVIIGYRRYKLVYVFFNVLMIFWFRDVFIVFLIDCLISFFFGFVIFIVLGVMVKVKGVEVVDVV